MAQWARFKDRAAGKWQLPLLVVSLVMLTQSLLRLRPAPTALPLEEAVEYLDTLVSADFYGQAMEIGEELLARKQHTDAERAPIHLQLARARYGEARRRNALTAAVGRKIVEHYQQAASHGQPLSGGDRENFGSALEWQHQFAAALEQYEKALEQGVEKPLDLRRRMLALMRTRVQTPLERFGDLLDRFISDTRDHRLDLALWAIESRLEVLQELGRLDEATTLLTRNHDRFYGSDWRDRFAYLEGWMLYSTGHHDEAETFLRAVQSRVGPEDEVYARTGWLLGRVVMEDDGPQRPLEGISFFSSVISYHAGEPYGVASRIGLAEALVMLERHDEAIHAYRIAFEELDSLGERRVVNLDALRTSLGVLADGQRQAGRLPEAVEYSSLAVGLVDPENVEQTTVFLQQLAQLQSQGAAEQAEAARTADSFPQQPGEGPWDEDHDLFAEAAATHLRISQINALNERIAAEASWRAAELYARARQPTRAAELYRAFAIERRQHPRVPRALLRIGQLHQAAGRLPDAVEAYQEAYRRFPRVLDGTRALVPLAQCYLAMGPDYEELAEETLLIVLDESEVFTPQAPEFAEALFLLGDALNRRGDFERAIATLEEALERYPEDPRVSRARFLLADSFLKSGLALKVEVAEARYAGEIEQIRAGSTARLRAAREHYRRLIAEYELHNPATLNRLEKVYLRHAYLYEADCLFEIQDYAGALKLYEEAAGMYKRTVSALGVYVQIINSHVFLGESEEARAALARAQVLVEAIPDEAFARWVSPETRDDWKRYFEWLGKSELF